MIRTYKYRLYPTRAQTAALNELLEITRQFYNYALQYRRERWQESRCAVTYNEQAAMWRDWRNETPDDNPLRLLNMSAGQQLLRRLDKAYREFLKGKRGRPRFKGKNRFHALEFRHGDGCKLKLGERVLFYVQNVGDIKVKFHRPLPEGATIQHIVLTRSCRKWYICLQLELPDLAPRAHDGDDFVAGGDIDPLRGQNHVGVDVGLLSLLALSNGATVDNPRWMRQTLSKLRRAQRRLSRRKRGSHRRRKAAFQVARLHEKVTNQRGDFWHKETRKLASTYSLIAIEDLTLGFLTQNGHLALSAHDAALGTFRQILGNKVEETGSQLVPVNPQYTSQVCSGCGAFVPKDLSVRIHACPHCGLTIDRDVNAARNILKRALERLGLSRQDGTWAVAPCVS
jgi:putative transposase